MTDSSGLVLSMSSSSVRSNDRNRRSRPRVTATPAAASSSLALKRDAPDSFGSSNTSSAGISDIAAAESGTPVFNLTRIDVQNTTQQQTLQQQQVLIQQTVLIQEDPRFAEVALQAHQAVADEKALLAAQAQVMVDAERDRIAQLAHAMMAEQQRNDQEVALQNNARRLMPLRFSALSCSCKRKSQLLPSGRTSRLPPQPRGTISLCRRRLRSGPETNVSRTKPSSSRRQKPLSPSSWRSQLPQRELCFGASSSSKPSSLEQTGSCSGEKPLLLARRLCWRVAIMAPLRRSPLLVQHALRLRAAPLTRSWVFSMAWRAVSPYSR